MYTLPPLAPAGPVVALGGVASYGSGVLPRAVALPNTGAPELRYVALAAFLLLVGGGVLVLRTVPPVWGRMVLRATVGGLIAAFAVRTIAIGAVTNGWDVIGLTVAVCTMTYCSLAVRQLLPAGRPDPAGISSASRAGAPSAAATLLPVVHS